MDEKSGIEGAEFRELVEAADPAIRQLLPGYVANRHADIGQFEEALALLDFPVLRRLGHNLRGSGAAYGLPPLSALGARIEQAAKTEAAGQLQDLKEEFKTMVIGLDAVVVDTVK